MKVTGLVVHYSLVAVVISAASPALSGANHVFKLVDSLDVKMCAHLQILRSVSANCTPHTVRASPVEYDFSISFLFFLIPNLSFF